MDQNLPPLSDKQMEFLYNSNAKFNLAHGSVRSGKTVCTILRFLEEVVHSPGETFVIFGYSLGSIYKNVVLVLQNSHELRCFGEFCTWSEHYSRLYFLDKTIFCIGAGDEGALGNIQGITIDVCYCDEFTLYPDHVIEMIKNRLSRDHSKLFASMNPKHPGHLLKKWIDYAEEGDPNYYALHFTLDDTPFVSQSYKDDLKKTSSGLYLRRYYYGEWCLAEGAIFDFFDRKMHTVDKPPCAAEYWIAAIDYGAVNPFACLLLGISTGKYTQMAPKIWVEDEYYYDPKILKKQKTNFEYAQDISRFLEPYFIRGIYIDPSAAAFKEELRRKGMKPIDANNEVEYGIQKVSEMLMKGDLLVLKNCKNLIREIEGYVWDSKKIEKGKEEPLKKADHAVDALRYAIATHRPIRSGLDDGGTVGGFRRI